MTTYFNENEPFVANWLCNLFPESVVDTRSIADVQPVELTDHRRFHFFAGIGGWEYALRLAGWPDEREIWTGSCPCQPFSAAGKRQGEADARHLWPEFKRLIAAKKPATVFGEQVASKAGREWLARVRADLEALGYAVGCADLCAAGVSAPRIRQRLFWVADTQGERLRTVPRRACRRRSQSETTGRVFECGRHGTDSRMGNANDPRLERRGGMPERPNQFAAWAPSVVIDCRDGKRRRAPIEPAFQPLAHGVPARVGRLRAYGNGIVPQLAAVFIQSFLEC